MADEKKPVVLKTKVETLCTNCQRGIAIGESVTTPNEDELNRGNVVCSDCTSQIDPKAARVSAAKAEAAPAPKSK